MLDTLKDFLDPINLAQLSSDEGFTDKQLANHINIFENDLPNINEADIVIIGCGESRGDGPEHNFYDSPNEIRAQFYKLYHWHSNVQIADFGNVKQGATIKDSYAVLQMIVAELINLNKKVLIIGGSHDLTVAQYGAYVTQEKIINIACVDAAINLNMDSFLPSQNFLMSVLTNEPNYVKHYTHIGFQSFLVHPQMLETIDKLRFDCYRVGKIKENLEEMEPLIRDANLLSFDIAAIQNAYAPSNTLSPNGFTGEEACTLMQYAGMSNKLSSIGIYGFMATNDKEQLTAKQISQMIWYFIDGVYKSKQEVPLTETSSYNEFVLVNADFETMFLQSKRTGRWWMKAHDNSFIPCTKTDYLLASKNEIPERWLRYAER